MDLILRSRPYHARLSFFLWMPQHGNGDLVSILVVGPDIESMPPFTKVFYVTLVRARVVDQTELPRFELPDRLGHFLPQKPSLDVGGSISSLLPQVDEFLDFLVYFDHFFSLNAQTQSIPEPAPAVKLFYSNSLRRNRFALPFSTAKEQKNGGRASQSESPVQSNVLWKRHGFDS